MQFVHYYISQARKKTRSLTASIDKNGLQRVFDTLKVDHLKALR